MGIRKGAVGIIFRQNKKNSYEFLILRRKFLWRGWEFAKGGVKESKENEETGVLREIKEETGLRQCCFYSNSKLPGLKVIKISSRVYLAFNSSVGATKGCDFLIASSRFSSRL